MESFPKQGMTYKQSMPKAMRFAKEGSSKLVNSVANQVGLHEGPKAEREFRNEVACKHQERSSKKYY